MAKIGNFSSSTRISDNQIPYFFITLYLLWRATNTLRSANGLRPLNVVCCFSSSNGISNNSLAIHSSAKEFETTLTPVKSKTTLSLSLISGNNSCLSFCPISRVPKSVPYCMNLNSTIMIPILLFQQTFRYIHWQHLPCGQQFGWGQSLLLYLFPYRLVYLAKDHSL